MPHYRVQKRFLVGCSFSTYSHGVSGLLFFFSYNLELCSAYLKPYRMEKRESVHQPKGTMGDIGSSLLDLSAQCFTSPVPI